MITKAQIVSVDTEYSDYAPELERGNPKLVVRCHTLTEVTRNARRWLNGYVSPASKSKEWGAILDARVLTPKRFHQRYAVPPATYINKDGKTCKWRDDDRIEAVREWKEAHKGVEMLSTTDAAAVEQAVGVIARDERVLVLIDSGDHQVWVQGEWVDKATGLTVPIKCLIDMVPSVDDPIYGKCLADLKTTTNASPRKFARDCYEYGYAIQGAFYLDLYVAATGEDRTDFCHVIQESFPPYELRSPPPLLDGNWIEVGRCQYRAMLAYYCKCLATDTWPGYDADGQWPVTSPEPWMLQQPLATWNEREQEEPETELAGAN